MIINQIRTVMKNNYHNNHDEIVKYNDNGENYNHNGSHDDIQ